MCQDHGHYKLSKIGIASYRVYGIEKKRCLKNTKTKPTQSSMTFAQVALRPLTPFGDQGWLTTGGDLELSYPVPGLSP